MGVPLFPGNTSASSVNIRLRPVADGSPEFLAGDGNFFLTACSESLIMRPNKAASPHQPRISRVQMFNAPAIIANAAPANKVPVMVACAFEGDGGSAQ